MLLEGLALLGYAAVELEPGPDRNRAGGDLGRARNGGGALGARRAQQAAQDQQLGQLNRVGGGALA